MRTNKFSLYILFFIVITACNKNNFNDVDFSNSIEPYVLISGEKKQSVEEKVDSLKLYVDLPISIAEDVAINYQVEGTAVDGTDYKLKNPGSVTIEFDPMATEPDQAEITIYTLDDTLVDGTKSLSIQLISAVSASGEFLNIGRNDDDVFSFDIQFSDNDCSSRLEGTYYSYFADDSTVNKEITVKKLNKITYEISDISAGFFDSFSPPNVPISTTMTYNCGELFMDDIILRHEYFTLYDIKGNETSDSTFTIEWEYLDLQGNLYAVTEVLFEKISDTIQSK